MVEPAPGGAPATFDRLRFASQLGTRRLGRELLVRGTVDSTNDVAWEALAAGAPDGTAVIADAQARGRGRGGRVWHTTPGRALAMSVLLSPGCERALLTVLPLGVGLALSRALDRLSVTSCLKWPNDVRVAGRKIAGVLCESRGTPSGDTAIVVGIGVNVLQSASEFPEALRPLATSLAIEGVATPRETVAAFVLDALEPMWTELNEAGPEPVLEAWRARADFWGRPLTVRTATGEVSGTARTLAADGALVLVTADGAESRVVAGDVVTP